MSKKYSKELSTKLKTIGIYQIAGGALGLVGLIWFIAQLPTVSSIGLVPVLVDLGLLSYSIYCGVLLLRQKENGLTASQINQYLQLVAISVFGFGYQYAAGVYLYGGIDWTTTLNLRWSVGFATPQLSFNSDHDIVIIKFNFAALFLSIYIDRLKRKIHENKMLALVSEIEVA